MHILDTFGPIWDASGLRGFYGEGYWFHRLVPGLSFKGSTLVSKTATTYPQAGNMEMEYGYRPLRLFPDCVYVDPIRGITLNSVGLSGPGIAKLIEIGEWVPNRGPFLISWMPIGLTPEDQKAEAREFVRLLKPALGFFLADTVGIQLNVSCPNVGADLSVITEKAEMLLSILAELELPVVVKLNLLVTPSAASRIAKHPACSGLCIANTAPFRTVLTRGEWVAYFPHGSPLRKRNESYGDGGLSGPPLFPFVCEWIEEFRRIDSATYVNAGGGVWHAHNVDTLKKVGANSIFIGTVAMLRPWRVKGIIERAHHVFS